MISAEIQDTPLQTYYAYHFAVKNVHNHFNDWMTVISNHRSFTNLIKDDTNLSRNKCKCRPINLQIHKIVAFYVNVYVQTPTSLSYNVQAILNDYDYCVLHFTGQS